MTSKHLAVFDGILAKGPYPPCLRMADRALLAGYPPLVPCHQTVNIIQQDASHGSFIILSNWKTLCYCRFLSLFTCNQRGYMIASWLGTFRVGRVSSWRKQYIFLVFFFISVFEFNRDHFVLVLYEWYQRDQPQIFAHVQNLIVIWWPWID